VKHQLRLLIGCLALAYSPTFADTIDDSVFQSQQLDLTDESGNQVTPPCFYELSITANGIASSRFSTDAYRDDHISYHEDFTLLSYNYFFDANNAFSFGAGYGDVGINWKQNPDFHRRHFETASVNLGALSKTDCGWLWRASLSARFSLNDGQVPTYVQYTHAIWGRYDLTPCIGTHIGYAAETGLRKDTLWPIIGLDYKYSDCLRFYAVYPFEANVHFDFCDPWALELSTRRFRYRDRVSKREPVPRALLEYRNSGAELRLLYNYAPIAAANIHVGYAFGGELRIGNYKNIDATHYKFRAAPYAGAELNLRF
jgi:hypothetical protein